jgi:RHS repeat-associated protein
LDYTWNWRNRLASAERSGGGITTYGYDHTGQRVFQATGSATTSYPNRYYNIASSSLTATTTKHIFSPDGALLATVVGSGAASASTTYLHPDHLGGTNVATDENGEVVQTLDYYPYGSQRIATGAFDEQRRFIGEEFDGDTEFSYLNARYYQSSRGQFMSQDPVFWEIGQTKDGKAVLANPQSLNSYSYSNGNPIIGKDPTGRAVYLAARPVIFGRQHLYYYVAPESGSAFSAAGPFTFGAGPQVPVLIGFGDLTTRIGYDPSNRDFDKGLSEATSYVELSAPDGETEDDLILGLYRGHVAVSRSDAKYWSLEIHPEKLTLIRTTMLTRLMDMEECLDSTTHLSHQSKRRARIKCAAGRCKEVWGRRFDRKIYWHI